MSEITYYRNNKSNLIFISCDEENLINPCGKLIELNEDLYEEVECCFNLLSIDQLHYIKMSEKRDVEQHRLECEEAQKVQVMDVKIRKKIESSLRNGNFRPTSEICTDAEWDMIDVYRAISGFYEMVSINKLTKDKNVIPKTFICKIGDSDKVLARYAHA